MSASWTADVAIGLAAFGGDAAWYLLLAACGAWAATAHGRPLRIWARGLAAGGGALLALSTVEWLGIDPWGLWRLLRRPAIVAKDPAGFLQDLVTYSPFDGGDGGLALAWPVCWFALCVALRLLLARLFLRRAARNFDRVALD